MGRMQNGLASGRGVLVGVVAVLVLATRICGAVEPIAIGPYVQNVTPESAVVCWATVTQESKLTGPDGKRMVRKYQHHELLLPRLRPNTTYEYDILGDGSPEGTGKFTTFPEEIVPFRFVAFGDTRSRHDVHAKLVERITAEEPRLVINTGDLVSDGRSISDWESFFAVNRELMRDIPYYPALGNHENDSPHYYDFFHLPGNERYYTFSVGDALFLFLDTEGPYYDTPVFLEGASRDAFWAGQNRRYMEVQKAWARRMLELQGDAGFVFVIMHKPLYTAKKSRVMDTARRRVFWDDMFERYGVQVVLCGHDHHYHHAVNKGTHHVISGGGGAPLYDTDAPQPETVRAVKVEHYIRIDIGLEKAALAAIDINGNIIEEFTVTKRR